MEPRLLLEDADDCQHDGLDDRRLERGEERRLPPAPRHRQPQGAQPRTGHGRAAQPRPIQAEQQAAKRNRRRDQSRELQRLDVCGHGIATHGPGKHERQRGVGERRPQQELRRRQGAVVPVHRERRRPEEHRCRQIRQPRLTPARVCHERPRGAGGVHQGDPARRGRRFLRGQQQTRQGEDAGSRRLDQAVRHALPPRQHLRRTCEAAGQQQQHHAGHRLGPRHQQLTGQVRSVNVHRSRDHVVARQAGDYQAHLRRRIGGDQPEAIRHTGQHHSVARTDDGQANGIRPGRGQGQQQHQRSAQRQHAGDEGGHPGRQPARLFLGRGLQFGRGDCAGQQQRHPGQGDGNREDVQRLLDVLGAVEYEAVRHAQRVERQRQGQKQSPGLARADLLLAVDSSQRQALCHHEQHRRHIAHHAQVVLPLVVDEVRHQQHARRRAQHRRGL